jgi:hypothetical protein
MADLKSPEPRLLNVMKSDETYASSSSGDCSDHDPYTLSVKTNTEKMKKETETLGPVLDSMQ